MHPAPLFLHRFLRYEGKYQPACKLHPRTGLCMERPLGTRARGRLRRFLIGRLRQAIYGDFQRAQKGNGTSHANREEEFSPPGFPGPGAAAARRGDRLPTETMKTKNIPRIAFLMALGSLTPLAMAQEKVERKPAVVVETTMAEPGTIAAALRDGVTFSILTKAIKATGLEATLGTKGSYTIFAPTDEAFGKLPEGTLATLMLPENKEKLRSLVLYHVVPGIFTSSDLKDGAIKSSNGEKFEIDIERNAIEVEDSKVAKADLVVSNGVIHSIDKVMVPKSLDGFAGLDED